MSTDQAFPYWSNPIVGPYTGGYCATNDPVNPNKYLVLEQFFRDPMCVNGPSAVNAVLLDRCVPDAASGAYKRASFVPGTTAYAAGVQMDSIGTLTIQAFSDIACNQRVGDAFTLPIPTAALGLPATQCTQGPTGFTDYSFKGGLYFFDDYSKMQATIANNFDQGVVLGTFADAQCTTVSSGLTLGGGLPIMLSYFANSAGCVLNIATKTSLRATCTGPTDGTTDTSGSGGSYGGLTGTITQFADAQCRRVSAATSTYNTGGYCWNSAASNGIVASVGAYTGGFCSVRYVL